MPTIETQTTIARINFRLPQDKKDVVERAALISGQSVTDFAIQALIAKATEVLERQQLRILSDRDRDIFLAMLDSDAEPNEALRKAAEDYKQYMGIP